MESGLYRPDSNRGTHIKQDTFSHIKHLINRKNVQPIDKNKFQSQIVKLEHFSKRRVKHSTPSSHDTTVPSTGEVMAKQQARENSCREHEKWLSPDSASLL